MPFEIVRNDITKMQVDAIVNTANPMPLVGAGVDAMIHKAAGPQLLLARKQIGNIPRGDAAVTPAYDLNAKCVIHTAGPVWQDGNSGEAQLLRSCYDRCLALGLKHRCKSIAFPLISTGNYGFPKDKALQIAIAAFSSFLVENEMQIYLVVFDHAAYKLSEKLFHRVASYIDEHFVDTCKFSAAMEAMRLPRQRNFEAQVMMAPSCAPRACKPSSLVDFLKKRDTSFVEELLSLIQKSGHKNSTIYKRANMSKQHFSKLILNPNATPTKSTAIALALALELDLQQTKDLIGRAGYTLTNSSIFDLIIQYYIEQRNYNIIEINIALYEFDQNLLGS